MDEPSSYFSSTVQGGPCTPSHRRAAKLESTSDSLSVTTKGEMLRLLRQRESAVLEMLMLPIDGDGIAGIFMSRSARIGLTRSTVAESMYTIVVVVERRRLVYRESGKFHGSRSKSQT